MRQSHPQDSAARHPAEVRSQEIYDDINARTAAYEDFDASRLEESRQFFDLSAAGLQTRAFDVLTCVAGLPIPDDLQQVLTKRLDEILSLVPASVRVYRVRPELLHWESHIIRRPGEPAAAVLSADLKGLFTDAVANIPAFDITLRGFFVSPDGTIAFQGYGPTADLRASLRQALPFSSARQNDTGHISVARILDPVGAGNFAGLLAMRRASDAAVLGELRVDEIKLVFEERWYMEAYRVEAIAQLASQ